MTLHEAWQCVKHYFGYTNVETCDWFDNPVGGLRGKIPNELIKKGQQKLVIDFIRLNYGNKK